MGVLFPCISVLSSDRANRRDLVGNLAAVKSAIRNELVVNNFNEYRGQLKGFFMRSVDETEAEDLIQELFIRLIRQVDKVPPDNPRGFLLAAATNLLRDRWRRRAVRKLDQMDCIDDFIYEFEDAYEFEPSLWYEQIEKLEQLDAALSGVGPKVASAFSRHRVEGSSYAEIAEDMGVSVSMVEKYISSALVVLRERHAELQIA